MFRGIEPKDPAASHHWEQAEVWSQPPEIHSNCLMREKGQKIQPLLTRPPLWFYLFSKIFVVWYLSLQLHCSWALLRAKGNSCWPAYVPVPPARAPSASAYKYQVIKLEVGSYLTWVRRTVTCKKYQIVNAEHEQLRRIFWLWYDHWNY